ncbi:MAG: cytochrome C oxidase subunit III, partial [Alphaproteobacteria bacterium]
MRERVVANLSVLPLHGQGSASVTWWGTLAFMLIEGTGFALIFAIYFYLADIAPEWPLGAPSPDLGPGSATTAILIASLLPNYLILRWAAQEQLTKVRIGLVVMLLFGIAPLVVRIFEFPALHVSWDTNAYGSI